MTDLPQSWSVKEICDAWNLSPRKVGALITSGLVGHYRGKRGARRLFPEHIAQLRRELEIQPQVRDEFTIPGQSPRSAAAHRRSA